MKYFVALEHMYSKGGVVTRFEYEPVNDNRHDTADAAYKELLTLREEFKPLTLCISQE